MTSPGAFLRPTSLALSISRVRSRSPSVTSRSPSLSRSLSPSTASLDRELPGTPRPDANNATSDQMFEYARRSSFSLPSLASTSLSGVRSLSTATADLAKPARSRSVWSEASPSQMSRPGLRLSDEEVGKLEFYSKFTPTSISLGNFLQYGSKSNRKGLETSFLFLKREIPVRLANIMMELQLLPDELLQQPSVQDIISQYAQSFAEVLQFENRQPDYKSYEEFNRLLTDLRLRHQDTVPHMANALQSMKEAGKLSISTSDQMNMVIQYFLDRLYMSRISIQMLISHHKALFCPEESKDSPIGMTGTIDPNCDVVKVAEAAYENAAFLCESIYMDVPKLKLTAKDLTTSTSAGNVDFPYIPNHLHHMFFEVFKNSMRATMESHEGEDVVPEIEVLVIKSEEDVCIKICDQGGGISRRVSDNVFLYLYTSATRAQVSQLSMGGTTSVDTPMHGLGYGLPLSRLYARYFGGDMKQVSVDGHGTDTFIYLQALQKDAKENLPIFNISSSNKLRNTTNQAPDWTRD